MKNKMLCSLVTMSVILGHCVLGQAAVKDMALEQESAFEAAATEVVTDKSQSEVKKEQKENDKPAPITVEGEEISFNNATGDVYAKGNVVITQKPAVVYADALTGNTKRTEVAIEDEARILQPGMVMNGHKTFYNYQKHTGTMDNAKGVVDKKHVTAEHIEFYPQQYIIYNGTMTKCPAKVPDYHVRAKKIEIWPDEKMIAYDADFLIKGKVIYHTKRYETKIGKNAPKESAFPRIDYDSDDGVSIAQTFQHPLMDDLYAFADLAYYSDAGYKPSYGIRLDKDQYNITVQQGNARDDDGNWIKKSPEFRFDYFKQHIPDTSWSYNFSAVYGKWKDDDKSSWHQDYVVYFTRDPIQVSKSLTLDTGFGYEILKESYNDSQVEKLKYDLTLTKIINPKVTVWSGYHHSTDGDKIFNYDSNNVSEELASGISYKLDEKNRVSVAQSFNLENGHTADMYYTWYHNLHCWNMKLTYHKDIDNRGKDDGLQLHIETATW